jgi:hypothetical protein
MYTSKRAIFCTSYIIFPKTPINLDGNLQADNLEACHAASPRINDFLSASCSGTKHPDFKNTVVKGHYVLSKREQRLVAEYRILIRDFAFETLAKDKYEKDN